MMSAGRAVSESRTAPSTDCSASRFCGGARGPSNPRWWPLVMGRSRALMRRAPSLGGGPEASRAPSAKAAHPALNRCDSAQSRHGSAALALASASGRRPELLLLDHHGLDVGEHAVADLDRHHARADRADRLVEVHLAPVDVDPARL